MNTAFKLLNLISASNVEALGDPKAYGLFDGFWGTIVGFLTTLLSFVMRLIYGGVRFVLNIVDFMQFFVQKLVGLDFWGTDNFDPSRLAESDIIFRFIYHDSVQRVFKFMIGVSLVLLIIFTIIAIRYIHNKETGNQFNTGCCF